MITILQDDTDKENHPGPRPQLKCQGELILSVCYIYLSLYCYIFLSLYYCILIYELTHVKNNHSLHEACYSLS